MPVTTPTQKATFEKRCHTPPTIEREKGRSTPTKFLKSLSNNVFKRNSFSRKTESSPEQPPVTRFSRSSKAFVRTKAPKPLNLSQPLSPPKTVKKYESLNKSSASVGSFQSAEKMTLYSPAAIHPALTSARPKNLAHMLQEAFDSPVIPRENSILGDSNFMRKGSPSISQNMSKSVSSLKTTKSFKKFVKEKCSICEEEICYNFSGEKIIELTCSHVCHYDCFLILSEATFETGENPLCSICHVRSGPKDPETMQNLVSKLLVNKKEANVTLTDHAKISSVPNEFFKEEIGQQYVELKSAKALDRNFPKFTPIEQIIKSADISYNGFKEKSMTDDIYQKILEELDSPDSIKEMEIMSFLESVTYEPLALATKYDTLPNVEYISDVNNSGNMLNITFPKSPDTNRNLFNELILNNDMEQEHEIKASLTKYIKRKFNKAISFRDLLLFDKVQFSTDGEDWDSNIICYLFQDIAIFYDSEEQRVVGKVPVGEISHVTEISPDKLIIDLKSTTLPEIYLKFHSEIGIDTTNYNNSKKWKYYLNNLNEIPHLLHVTTNAMSLIPKELQNEINNYEMSFDSSKLNEPWLNVKLPLRLIVCINLNLAPDNNEVAYTLESYTNQLKQDLHQLVDKLDDNDLLGFIIVGKEGQEYINNRGTFIGMINKTWELWPKIIDTLEVNDNVHFNSVEQEINCTLETCYRLISTLSADDKDKYKNEILFFNKTDKRQKELVNGLKLSKKMHETIFQKHQFQINEYLMSNTGLISDCMDKISSMKIIKNLQIEINDKIIYIGDIIPDEAQTIDLYYYPTVITDETVCKLTWFDEKTKIHNEEIIQIQKKDN